MANNKSVYQQINSVSVPKDALREIIIYNDDLSKKDLRVFLLLLTHLDGFNPNTKAQDPLNYKKINSSAIADELGFSKKEVIKALENLESYGIIESGSSSVVSFGWRFRF